MINVDMRRETSGFTLIEMLIVVAIIGILSSVILTALGPARDKAKDARIIQEVNQARAIAESLGANGTYGGVPTVTADSVSSITDPDLQSLASDIKTQGGGLYMEKALSSPYNWYIVFSALNTLVGPQSDQTQYYCVDSSGHAVYTTTNPDGSQNSCPTGS